MTKIAIVEDDRDIAELIDYNLKSEKWMTELFFSGSEALKRIPRLMPDLILLDLMLPGVDGLEICRRLKNDERTRSIPILILTAKAEEVDRIVGFELGADDYLTKPFSPRELILRVKAILRRLQSLDKTTKQTPISYKNLYLDPARFEVMINQKPVKLTAIEFKLLQFLLNTKGRVATRDLLLDHVWGYDSVLTTRTVDTHVKRLRSKLGESGEYIETIRGIGYRIKD